MHLLVFELAGRSYALPAERVRELARAAAITPLPDAPALVEGVLNVRGVIVPVYDLRARLGVPPRVLHPDEFLVVAVGAGGRLVALRVDAVHELLEVADAEVRALPESRTATPGLDDESRGNIVAGIGTLADGLLLVHDLDALFSLRDERALDAALAVRA